ncbi:MAG TPA: PLP-dependent aminotransferase family protein [Candidatus Eremiobacteraceae bacterium]|nr:PLP-dependent aminotransferase family protein [Candidatus Eremiobacteraceae bacterium]
MPATLTQIQFHSRDRRPLYQQLAEGIAQQIRNGALPLGTRLPPLRELAKRHAVALVTASQAYEALSAEGLVESRTGRGTFVSFDSDAVETIEAPRPATSRQDDQWDSALSRYSAQTRRVAAMHLLRSSFRPGTIALSNGHTAPETYPLADFARCYARTFLDDPPEIHQYRADRGDPALREIFAARLRARGADVSADDILVVSGAQQALSLVAETFLDLGDFAAAEAPTYFSALEVFDQKRVSWVNLAGDADGALPDSIAQAVRRFSPRLMYLNTASQNPSGSFLARSRHRAVLDVARAAKLTIVEDQTSWLLSYEGEAPPPLLASDTDGRVVLIESLSKLLFPSLRIGYIAARGHAMQELVAAKLRADTFTTTVAQRALVRFIESKASARHLRTTRFLYRRRRDALMTALAGVLPDGARAIAPRGGVNVWVELPRDWSSLELFGYAAQEGVLFLPGTPFYPTMPANNTLRLSFGTLPENLAGEAMARLGRAIRHYASARKKARRTDVAAAAV